MGATITNRHCVSAGGQAIAMLTSVGTHTNAAVQTVTETQWWHRDHLGSIATLTDASYAVTQRFSYDPSGKRRAVGEGKCGQGAMTAALGKAITSNLPKGDYRLDTVRAAVIGGALSKLGGGKLANGAAMGAFQYLFNCLAHKCNGADYDSKNPKFHEYGPFASSICDIATAGCIEAARQQLLCNSAPGQGECAVIGQTISQGLTGGNSITQYALTRDMVINGTLPGHVFDDGYVVRWLSVNDAGIAQI